MNKFKSPINENTYTEIASFFSRNKGSISTLPNDHIEEFKKNYPTFKYLISDLTESEQLRAWFYLRRLVKTHLYQKKVDIDAYKDKKSNFKKNILLNLLIFLMIIVVGWLFFSFFAGKSKPLTKEQEMENITYNAQQTVKLRLKDPDSAEFRNSSGRCGLVNAKNSFGAFTGFSRYIVVADKVTLETDRMPDDMSFDEFWHGMCQNQ